MNKIFLSKMLVLATNRHDGQFDRGGNPYILHPLTVMNLVDARVADDEIRCIALGHDLVENTGLTYQELYDLGFSERIVSGIRCLTKVPGETYEEYKNKVKSNQDSVYVKMADLKHNTDITRLKGISDKDLERTKRYYSFYLELSNFTR